MNKDTRAAIGGGVGALVGFKLVKSAPLVGGLLGALFGYWSANTIYGDTTPEAEALQQEAAAAGQTQAGD